MFLQIVEKDSQKSCAEIMRYEDNNNHTDAGANQLQMLPFIVANKDLYPNLQVVPQVPK